MVARFSELTCFGFGVVCCLCEDGQYVESGVRGVCWCWFGVAVLLHRSQLICMSLCCWSFGVGL